MDGLYDCGSVFQLVPSGNNYTYNSLHDFNCQTGGAFSYGNVVMDTSGNLYGTTTTTVFEITPQE